jgi:uncharacterized membrane protein
MRLEFLSEFKHPAWITTLGMAGGYAVLLLLMTILLFIIPYVIFTSF